MCVQDESEARHGEVHHVTQRGGDHDKNYEREKERRFYCDAKRGRL